MDFKTELSKVEYDQSKAAGYGYTGPKGPRDGENFKRARRIANAAVNHFLRLQQEKGSDAAIADVTANSSPDVAFTRTQLTELPKMKIRNVFGETFHYVLIEGVTAQPVIKMFEARDDFYYIGKRPDTDVPRLLYDVSQRSESLLVLDWSSFDASAQLWEIDTAFNLVESLLKFPNPETRAAFEYAKAVFKKRKLAAPDGTLFMREGGVPSGSVFTHLIDSIINYLRILYLCHKHQVETTAIYTHGDDGLVGLTAPAKPPLSAFAETAAEHDWGLNPDKCGWAYDPSDIDFLGRSVRGGYNTREELKALRLILYPEYPVESPEISVARCYAIMADSGYSSPAVVELMRRAVVRYGVHTALPKKHQLWHTQFSHEDEIQMY